MGGGSLMGADGTACRHSLSAMSKYERSGNGEAARGLVA